MIGLLISVPIFALLLAFITKWLRATYRLCGKSKFDLQGIYFDFGMSIFMAIFVSIVVGHLIAEVPVLALVPVVVYGVYRASRWWFENKIAK